MFSHKISLIKKNESREAKDKFKFLSILALIFTKDIRERSPNLTKNLTYKLKESADLCHY